MSRAARLVRNTHLDPLTLTLRAHEIAENALQVQLTGQDDFGSHTDLESVRAERVGTRAVLSALAGPIDSRVPTPPGSGRPCAAPWPRSRRRPARTAHVPVTALPRGARAPRCGLGLLTQRLAAIPATLEPRLTVASGSVETGRSEFTVPRRRVLTGAAAVGGAGVAGGLVNATARAAESHSPEAATDRVVAFHGEHQAGVATPRQQYAAFLAADATAASRGDLKLLLKLLTRGARTLTAGGRPADAGIGAPPADDGTMGPVVPADGLT